MESLLALFQFPEQFISTETLIIISVVSLIFFVGTLLAIPAILVRLPSDYFVEETPRVWLDGNHPLIRGMGLLLKNGVGLIFLLAGIAMLVLPGQGILTMLIGISLIDFPGKRNLERKLISLPKVFQGINALREKFGKPPFQL